MKPSSGLAWQAAQWPAPARVRAGHTLRAGGHSSGAWGAPASAEGPSAPGLNLGLRTGDDPSAVLANRRLVSAALRGSPIWLDQVHGVDVHRVDSMPAKGLEEPSNACALHAGYPEQVAEPKADAAITALTGVPLVILSADCLPVLICDREGTVVGAAHAGWRGLAGGVLERLMSEALKMTRGAQWIAWLGPAIGPVAFEVGEEVLAAFQAADPGAGLCFTPGRARGKWQADLFALARRRLLAAGVSAVYGGGDCTYADPQRLYSYRRDRTTGRLGSFIWIEDRPSE